MDVKITIGYDFDGAVSEGIVPDGVIVTGNYKENEAKLRAFLKGMGREDIQIYFLPDEIEHTLDNIAKYKSEVVNELGLTKFFENDEFEVNYLREHTDAEIVHVFQGMKFVTISSGWDGLPIAYHLQNEGYDSIVGQVQDFKELDIDKEPEEPDDKKERLSQYNDMVRKYPARKVIDALKKAKNKDEYFIFFDQNNLFKYAEELLAAGFTKGLFPTKDDFEFEKDRDRAMEFVKEHYPDVKIIPFQTAKTVDEAKKIVEESESPLVIQSMGDYVGTIVPPDDLEQNKKQILSALDKHAKDYSQGEILLKEKLIQPVEITPQIVFWNGQPAFTDIDLETKNIGDGENNGNQVGCGTNLIIATTEEDKINHIAFPPKVFEMARERKGIFVWDISLYVTDKGIFFGEFCSNRFGYDALMTETSMSGGVGKHFESIMNNEVPFQHQFGGAVRVFNLNRSKDVEIGIENNEYTYLYEVKKDKDKLLSVGDCWDLGVITGCGDTVQDSIENVYENLQALSFKEKYTRTKEDFLSDYPTSIIKRYNTTNGIYFAAPDFESSDKESDYSQKLEIAKGEIQKDSDNKVSKMKEKHSSDIEGIKSQIKSIINA